MARITLGYREVITEGGEALPCPELVRQLQEAGFVLLGRMSTDISSDDLERLVSKYDAAGAKVMRDDVAMPSVVLASPDADAFVEIDWFVDQPFARFRTVMDDGRVVETHSAWDKLPPLPRSMRMARKHMVLVEEQLKAATSDRDIAVVGLESPRELWQAHYERVAGYDATPIEHRSMQQALNLWGLLLTHAVKCSGRAHRIANTFSIGLLFGTAILLHLLVDDPLVRLVPIAVLILVWIPFTVWFNTRACYWRWPRPRLQDIRSL